MAVRASMGVALKTIDDTPIRKAFPTTEQETDTVKRQGRALITLRSVDRDGDVMEPRGLDTDNFDKNPVVLLNHASWELPIGRKEQFTKDDEWIEAIWQFAEAKHNPKAEFTFQMWKDRFLNATSICFMPDYNEATTKTILPGQTGFYYPKSELWEFSVATIPAHPDALRRSKTMNAAYRQLMEEGPVYAQHLMVSDGRLDELHDFDTSLYDPAVLQGNQYVLILDYFNKREVRDLGVQTHEHARQAADITMKREKIRSIVMAVLAKKVADHGGVGIYVNCEEFFHDFSSMQIGLSDVSNRRVFNSLQEAENFLGGSDPVVGSSSRTVTLNDGSHTVSLEAATEGKTIGKVICDTLKSKARENLAESFSGMSLKQELKAKNAKIGHMLPNIATRIFNTPLWIDPGKLEVLLSVFGSRIGLETDDSPHDIKSFLSFEVEKKATLDSGDPLYPINNGVAMIPVEGTLVNKGDWVGADSGLTSYQYLSKALETAMADDAVKAIAFNIDSPGGEADGLVDFVEEIQAARGTGTKPIHAIVDSMAFSAAYAVASATDHISVSRTGGIGSIGVVATHLDRSKRVSRDGYKVNFIYAGDKKVDANPYEPLSDRARGDIQDEVDRHYEMFVDMVVQGRGLSASAVRATEAGLYWGTAGVDEGLADSMLTAKASLTQLIDQIGGAEEPVAPTATDSGESTSEETEAVEAKNGEGSLFTHEQLRDAAREASATTKALAALEVLSAPEEQATMFLDEISPPSSNAEDESMKLLEELGEEG